jgi:GNAT superfamily N-acetyltransferase
MTHTVRRAGAADEEAARAIIDEYNDAVEVSVRDDAQALRSYLNGPGALWLAFDGERTVGCVVLRPLTGVAPRACEVKRLYVRPAHRGAGLAGMLMDALETYARGAGYDAIYLDSKEGLDDAVRLYRRRGYVDVPRYNDNPDAIIFMRRALI